MYEGGTYAVSGLGYGSKKIQGITFVDTGSGTQYKKFHSQLFIKCQEENCMLFYAASPWRDCLQLRKPKLCSILYLPDYSLYEADSVFYQAVGIPADFFSDERKSEERGGNEGYPFGEKHDGYKLGSAFA